MDARQNPWCSDQTCCSDYPHASLCKTPNAVLTAARVRHCVPVKNHDNPLLGENLKYIPGQTGSPTRPSARSCAEWFSPTSQPVLRLVAVRELRLSQYAIENLFQIDDICSIHETNRMVLVPKGQNPIRLTGLSTVRPIPAL